VFTDAMTFLDHKGRRTHLWVNKEVIIDDEQAYMDMMLDRICSVLEEPVDMYVNSCFLPDAMSDRYDMFWECLGKKWKGFGDKRALSYSE
jgi:hypothetical protein